MAVKRMRVEIAQDRVEQLKQKLAETRLPNEIENAGWSRGPPLADIKRLINGWKTFDWRATEAQINQNEQFVTSIEPDGFEALDIHFIHQRSDNPDAIPLLFIHGWPGSFLEATKLKSLLTKHDSDPSTPSFHLIAPSLPNFGFSSGTRLPSFGLRQYAETLHKLMLSLNYTTYATQSGDWGYWIARSLGHSYPASVIASHYNMAMALPPKLIQHPLLYLQYQLTPATAAERATAGRTAWFRKWSRGYNLLQSTRPQTLGYGLADSPVALLAWVYEKLHDWSDNDSGPAWTDEEILTAVSVYWFSRAGPAAPQRIYYEVANEKDPRYTYEAMMGWMGGGVKLGITYNPKELEAWPRIWSKTLGKVVYEVENERGG